MIKSYKDLTVWQKSSEVDSLLIEIMKMLNSLNSALVAKS
jgi:hypothetical protein